MKRGLWILAALAMTVAACGIAGWPDWQDWRRTQVLNESRPESDMAVLSGTEIRIRRQAVLTLPDLPDRAVIWLQLAVSPTPAAAASLGGCNPVLRDGQGRRFLPLSDELGLKLLKILGRDWAISCAQSLRAADGAGAVSDQVYLVPVDVVDALELEVSGPETRPDGAIFTLSPQPLTLP